MSVNVDRLQQPDINRHNWAATPMVSHRHPACVCVCVCVHGRGSALKTTWRLAQFHSAAYISSDLRYVPHSHLTLFTPSTKHQTEIKQTYMHNGSPSVSAEPSCGVCFKVWVWSPQWKRTSDKCLNLRSGAHSCDPSRTDFSHMTKVCHRRNDSLC